jgi:SAM-dependent methyltransferase
VGTPQESTGLVDMDLVSASGADHGVVRAAHRLYEHLIGIWAPGIIEAAFDLDVFTTLGDRPVTAAQLADELDADPRGMRVLLDALYAYEIIDRTVTDGAVGYTLPPDLRECLRPDGLYSLAGKMRYDRMRAWDAWRNLADEVRGTGGATQQHNQISDVQYESLARGINFWAPPIVSALAGALRELGWTPEQATKLLDVGCGTGLYSQLMLREFPAMSGLGLDVPRIVPIARSQSEQVGVQARFDAVVRDFWEQDWGSGFDLVLFANIFHLQTPDAAQDLSLKASKSLADGGVVAIIDQIIDDGNGPGTTQDRFFRLFAASMLATGGGDAYTLSEYDQWLNTAGLRRIRLIDTPMHRILLAVRA